MVTVWIPPAWRTYTGGDRVLLEAADIGEVVRTLAARFPHLQGWLFEPDGGLKYWINVFVNGQDMRLLMGAETPLHPGDDVRIILSIAGG